MPTATDEQQVREFLKRAEIKTMRKDLSKLREADALVERDKIVKIKTLDEQQAERAQKAEEARQKDTSKIGDVLEKSITQEREAEKSLRTYATEPERQQIFLFESEKLSLENIVRDIEEKKEPALQQQKMRLLGEKKNWEQKLISIVEQEKKFQGEQEFIKNKADSSGIQSQKKSLQSRFQDIDTEIQKVEKKRWEAEKQIAAIYDKINQIDLEAAKLVEEKNNALGKITGIEASLRDLFSQIVEREEARRQGVSDRQKKEKEELAQSRFEEKERMQREQWTGKEIPQPERDFARKLSIKSAPNEQKQREQFVQDVEEGAQSPLANKPKIELPPPPRKM